MTARGDVTAQWSARVAQRIRTRQRRRGRLRWVLAVVTVLGSATLVAAPSGIASTPSSLVDVAVGATVPSANDRAPPRPARPAASSEAPPAPALAGDGLLELTL